ncbi:(R)-2-hydroxyacyl-CoA dehydratase YjiM [Citrifermentans bemidjiense Bem]|uniref:(R)-2-hydroxyacyl-CoA dehydratase YjiM n=1 Tax=Citrifermentans bemidjiense (strain ATCC BAA-1014 / DSM 16622 / JCM 12645 / Bem) TaxID=404380 RepID=B5ECL8_CITBB|nr:double-cubane-cluster-containing anaerobic reductase [Citrifermentans bemidjiense]ACH39053.1 (R)-2-hydroxyacyl-CoA dehydratase YjiM [Citrifermentans bemidjiense Bem]
MIEPQTAGGTKTAAFEEIATLRERNALALKEAKESGLKVVGTYCLYSPTELIVAAGAIPVSLCGTSQTPIAAAEKVLPRSLCPLIKSSYGFAITDTCPFFHFSDMLVAETTCDGKKKMYELLGEMKPLHLMQLPQIQDEAALDYWMVELKRLIARLEGEFGVEITRERLASAIELVNEERRSLQALQDVSKLKPTPISGSDLLTVLHNRGFCVDKEQAIELLDRLTAELAERSGKGISPYDERTPRILLTGVPVGLGSDKVVRLIEESGGCVVCFESCGGYKKVDRVEATDDPLRAIAEKYLRIPCSCMSPNHRRLELLDRLADEFQVDGIIDLTWQGCHTYNIESYAVKRHLQQGSQLPFLQIETDYSESDTQQLKVRIEAFLEMIGRRRAKLGNAKAKV